jgi:hypothetical protein
LNGKRDALNFHNKSRRTRKGGSSRSLGICASWRRIAAATFAVLSYFASTRAISAQNDGLSEYAVKAAFLFHFAQFVEWPAESLKEAGSPLTYCVIGEDPFQGALEQALSGKVIGERPVRVLHIKQDEEIRGCQVLFIGIVDKKRLAADLEKVKGKPVLTVGESEHFAQQGGMIGFCPEASKIRFEINLGAATRANLKISAKLLSLAKTVLGRPEGAS